MPCADPALETPVRQSSDCDRAVLTAEGDCSSATAVPPFAGAFSHQAELAGKTGSSKQSSFRKRFFIIAVRTLLIVILVRTFIGEASVVPTSSMEGTILVGDHLFWNKAFYGPEIPFTSWRLPRLKSVRRGEIVAFRYPRDPNQVFLKRVEAVSGDRIEIHNGNVFVNGQLVRESYAMHNPLFPRAAGQMTQRVVPPGTLFMLGDNRDNSSDSRDWGVVPERNVLGSPLMIFWSYDAPSAEWLDTNPSHRFRFYGSMLVHLFSRTRWSRMGTLL